MSSASTPSSEVWDVPTTNPLHDILTAANNAAVTDVSAIESGTTAPLNILWSFYNKVPVTSNIDSKTAKHINNQRSIKASPKQIYLDLISAPPSTITDPDEAFLYALGIPRELVTGEIHLHVRHTSGHGTRHWRIIIVNTQWSCIFNAYPDAFLDI